MLFHSFWVFNDNKLISSEILGINYLFMSEMDKNGGSGMVVARKINNNFIFLDETGDIPKRICRVVSVES